MKPEYRRFAPYLAVVVVVGAGAALWAWHSKVDADGVSARKGAMVAPVNPPPAASSVSRSITVPAHSNFMAAMAPFHLASGVLHELVAAARPVYNLANIRAGRTLTLVLTTGGELTALAYQVDGDHQLWLRAKPAAVAGGAPVWAASIEAIPFTTRLVGVCGEVQSSLFQAVEDAGAQDELAVKMAGIFGWDLDFYTDTRQGDEFKVLVEEHFREGKFAGYGQIVAAEYVNGGHPYTALRFHDRQGYLAYYRPDGRPMKREFLKSPLKFDARVTSGFSYHRYHPILKIYRPHLGTDLAAPMGTPVQTIGAGVVIYAGRKGEDGNMVEIRHPHHYKTLYLHLSKILVHVGEHVAQGQRIGRVGMTGLATGPHLDFRVEHNGVFKNYEIFRKKLPPGLPIRQQLMPQFEALRSTLMPELNRLEPGAETRTATATTGN
ncbi:MAG: peptidoglycan DD-metalloendopeptidase family protein [Terriglobales bacterium]